MNNANRMLYFGISVIVLGLMLFAYSLSSYNEVKGLYNKIDFDELENNAQIPTSEKYHKYLSISDFLNQALKKNKNLPIKNTSCVYLDYAQRNTLGLYKLIFKNSNEDYERKETTEKNIKFLYDILDNYRICPKSAEYKKELKNIIDELENYEDYSKSIDIEDFINNNTPQINENTEDLSEDEIYADSTQETETEEVKE